MPPSDTTRTFRTHDGLSLVARHWLPKTPPRASLLLIHGYAEHCGRYDHVAETFVDEGVAVHAYDQRGHGRSEGRQAYVDQFEHYLTDLDAFRLHVAPPSEVPLFIFGHSMGGLVALLYTLNRRPDLRGLILSAPAIEINSDLAPFLRRGAQVLGRLLPTLPTVRSPEGAISRDPAVVEAAQNDPLNYHGRTLARTGAELLRAGNEAQQCLHELATPFLVLHGTADPLASPSWSRQLYQRAAATDKTLKLYDGLYHETFNEPERAEVLGDIRTWLAERLPTDQTP